MSLRGKVALVTGGGSGIGEAIVRRLAKEGASVVVADLNRSSAERVANELQSITATAPCVVDVANKQSVDAMVRFAVERFGALHIAVNSAGIGMQKSFLETTPEEFERVLRINLFGSFYVTQAAAKQMLKQLPDGGRTPTNRNNAGAIIMIASITAHRGTLGRCAYGSSKAAVVNMTQTIANELGTTGVRCNVICPGPVDTELARQHHVGETRQAFCDDTPMRRYAHADEVAGAVVFLASDDATYITGHALNIDGGYSGAGLLGIPVPGVLSLPRGKMLATPTAKL